MQPAPSHHHTGVEIRVKGRIDEHWSSWFGDLTIQYTDQDETVLCGEVRDQSELYGLLARLRDLGLPLVSVCLDVWRP